MSYEIVIYSKVAKSIKKVNIAGGVERLKAIEKEIEGIGIKICDFCDYLNEFEHLVVK
ncbi:hypothetical protein [Geoglobus ahangari]